MVLWYPREFASFVQVVEVALQPTAKLIAREGQWALFESIILEHGVTSSDPPPEKPLPPTVRNLVQDELRRQFPQH
jgi:hypothetical protein